MGELLPVPDGDHVASHRTFPFPPMLPLLRSWFWCLTQLVGLPSHVNGWWSTFVPHFSDEVTAAIFY